MPIYALGDLQPTIALSAFVHPDAVLIGDVVVGEEASIWPGAVLRGDNNTITVGDQTSVQDGTVVHCTERCPPRSAPAAWSATGRTWKAARSPTTR